LATPPVEEPRASCRQPQHTVRDFFGEMSLLDGKPRSATVDADSPMRLLVVGGREFWQLLTAAPPLALAIMKTLSGRVRDAEAAISA